MKAAMLATVLLISSLATSKADDIPAGRVGHRLGTYLTIEGSALHLTWL